MQLNLLKTHDSQTESSLKLIISPIVYSSMICCIQAFKEKFYNHNGELSHFVLLRIFLYCDVLTCVIFFQYLYVIMIFYTKFKCDKSTNLKGINNKTE